MLPPSVREATISRARIPSNAGGKQLLGDFGGSPLGSVESPHHPEAF